MIRTGKGAGKIAAALCAFAVMAGAAGNAWSASAGGWDEPHKPFHIFGNTYYVGTAGLSSVLITSEYGHVLLDAGTAGAARIIAANIEELGFKLGDVKAILISHAHHDHVGGLAELQRVTGAQVYALRPAEQVLRTGKLPKEDPQVSARMPAISKVPQVWIVQDDQLLGVGSIRLRAIATPGHTPGGSSWSWDACEGSKCLAAVYADSLTAVPAGKYRFTDHPEVVQSFEQSFARLEAVKCELLLTPHPEASGGLERLQQAGGDADKLKDDNACKNYVQKARDGLKQVLASGK